MTGTIEHHLAAWLVADELDARFELAALPDEFAPDAEERDLRPSRPAPLRVSTKTPRSVRASAMRTPAGRARVLHTFCHHELQAAELFAWAVLRFPRTEVAFRRGLLQLLQDELRHARLYRAEIERLGARFGDHPVRDWFWERVPLRPDPISFVAFLGIGLEGGNLEHARRYAVRFREAGDERAARVQDVVAREEEAHVRFAATWFRRWTGGTDFDAWRARLPEPLSPSILRGTPVDRASRRRAGLDDAFLDALEEWPCASPRS